ncbi:MAG: hypothetical protein KDD70_13180 [Bdellovibrionales bacterium]|nr:hypothetical protein [Bdellovibrionales bacterium]
MTETKNIEAVGRYFQEIGLQPISTSKINLRWKGNFRGREVSVLFSRRSRTKYHGEHVRTRQYVGHQLVFETPLKISTRFSVTKEKDDSKAAQKLRSLVSLEPFPLAADSGRELSAYTCDKEWAKDFTSDEEVQRVLGGGFMSPTAAESVVFGLFPGADTPGIATFTCRIPLSSVTKPMCKLAVESLVTLADASEKYTPRKVVSLSRVERLIKKQPFLFVFGLMACIVLLGLIFSAALIALAASGATPLVMPAFLIVMYLLYRRYFK